MRETTPRLPENTRPMEVAGRPVQIREGTTGLQQSSYQANYERQPLRGNEPSANRRARRITPFTTNGTPEAQNTREQPRPNNHTITPFFINRPPERQNTGEPSTPSDYTTTPSPFRGGRNAERQNTGEPSTPSDYTTTPDPLILNRRNAERQNPGGPPRTRGGRNNEEIIEPYNPPRFQGLNTNLPAGRINEALPPLPRGRDANPGPRPSGHRRELNPVPQTNREVGPRQRPIQYGSPTTESITSGLPDYRAQAGDGEAMPQTPSYHSGDNNNNN